jgi:hypothetical protein
VISGEAVESLLEGRVVESADVAGDEVILHFTDGSRLRVMTNDTLDVELVEP